MKFGDRLKEIRKKKGLSQKELGQRLGVSQAMIAQYEKGDRNPKLETVKKIAAALEVGTDYLITLGTIDLISSTLSDKNGFSEDEILKMLNAPGVTFERLYNTLETDRIDTEKELLSNYRKLNNNGQEKALDQVEMLTKIEEYKAKD